MEDKRVVIGADHAGFELKEKVKRWLFKEGYEVHDVGAFFHDKDDDYPEYAFAVGRHVVLNNGSRGVLFCGSGSGMAIAANKVPGVRAVCATDLAMAKHAMTDNNSNVLTLSGSLNQAKVRKIVSTWLETKFNHEPRHSRRIRQISNYES